MRIQEHIDYWIKSAEHDLDTAQSLLDTNKFDWCLFIGHLVLEKALKDLFVKVTDNPIPPRIHNLIRLSELAGIEVSEEEKIFLDEVNDFHLQTRYPDYKLEFHQLCTEDFTKIYFSKIKEFFTWLKSMLQ